MKSKTSLKKEFDTIYTEFKDEKQLGEECKVQNINSELLFCKNEQHVIEPCFDTLLEKKRHIVSQHSCPIVKCNFFPEFDNEMMDHLKSIHENKKHVELCNIC